MQRCHPRPSPTTPEFLTAFRRWPRLSQSFTRLSGFIRLGVALDHVAQFLNTLFIFGFETAYFRFSSNEENRKTIYNTAALSLFFSTLLFTAILWLNQGTLGKVTGLADLPQIIQLSIFIIALDTLSTIPFARLRQEGRPVKFAAAKIIGIIINHHHFANQIFINITVTINGKNQNMYLTLQKDGENWKILEVESETRPIMITPSS